MKAEPEYLDKFLINDMKLNPLRRLVVSKCLKMYENIFFIARKKVYFFLESVPRKIGVTNQNNSLNQYLYNVYVGIFRLKTI